MLATHPSAHLLRVLLAAVTLFAAALTAPAATPANPPANSKSQVAQNYGKLPLSFEANQGQSDPQVKFLSRGNGYSLFLTNRAAVLSLSKPSPANPALKGYVLKGDGFSRRVTGPKGVGALAPEGSATQSDTIEMQLANSNPAAQVSGADLLPSIANYFLGNDPAKWHTNVPTYAKVKYANVYDGIDLVYYGNQRKLEYDFIVQPGASPKNIQLHFAGAQKLKLDSDGNLEVIGKNGQITFQKPVLYQEKDGQRQPIEGKFNLQADNKITFAVGKYDQSRPLVVDPVLAYSTYLGSSGEFTGDAANGIAVDSSGDAYVVGSTESSNFPVTPGAVQQKSDKSGEAYTAFVSKLNPGGTALLFSTYLGGSTNDLANAIVVDSKGNAYIGGQTESTDFPVTDGALQTNGGGSAYSGFLTKLSPDGSSLVYSTYLGGQANGVAVGASGIAYVAGIGEPSDLPLPPDAFQTTLGASYVAAVNPTGTALIYATLLGGSNIDIARAITVDSDGDAFVVGETTSPDFPITEGAFQTKIAGGANAFITELNPTGTGLVYSTFLGGSGIPVGSGNADYGDQAFAIAIGGSGNVYVAGQAFSFDFPTTKGALQTQNLAVDGSGTGFVTVMNNKLSQPIYSTFLGGSVADIAYAIGVDGLANVYVTGNTQSANFPVTPDAFQITNHNSGQSEGTAFVSKLNPAGSSLLYSTYFGGDGGEVATALALDASANVYIAGGTFSDNFPITLGAYQTTKKSTYNSNAFISKLDLSASGATIATSTTLTSNANPQAAGQPVTLTATVSASTGTVTPTGSVVFAIDGKTVATVTLASGKATYSTSALSAGSHSVTATYGGSPAFTGSSASLTQVINATNTQTATPVFSPAVGTYAPPLTVTITDATAGAVIYYTTTGAAPTTASTKYAAPITVSTNETVEAIAVAAGYANSAVASATYTIQPLTARALQFIPITPCRIADTRNAAGAFGGPELAAAATRTFNVPQSACGIPSTATAYSLNVTVVPIASLGYLSIWPAGEPQPVVSTLNSGDGRVKANATITPAGTNGGVSVYASDATQFILDIDGYFVPAGTSASGLEFFPLTPCRIADTRNATGPLGGPSLAANTARAFPVQSSACGIPSTAKAYSLNITAVPHESLGFLSLWPSGEAQPVVSTLNASTGAVTANAAIVPAGTGGDISILVSDPSDVILDVNGYFAPPAAGGLSLYTVTPCRALDTRNTSAFDGTLTVPIHTSVCAPPATAQAYVLNATALPVTSLSYLTLWAAGGAQPDVSTLNASDGAITSNMAIVPTTNGSVDAFSTDSTQLLLDLSSYFAP